MFGQRLEATVEALGDKAELPFIVAPVQLTQDESRFTAAGQFDNALDHRFTSNLDRDQQRAQRGNCLAGIASGAERNLLNRGIDVGQIDGKSRVDAFGQQPD